MTTTKFEVVYNDQKQAISKKGVIYTVGVQKKEIIEATAVKVSEQGITFLMGGNVVAHYAKLKSFKEIK